MGKIKAFSEKSEVLGEDRPPLGQGREDYIIARALHVAAKAVLTDRHPAYSDAEDMQFLLRSQFSGYCEPFRQEDNLKMALALGFDPRSDRGCDPAAVSAFLASEAGRRN